MSKGTGTHLLEHRRRRGNTNGKHRALQLVARTGAIDFDDASFPLYADAARSVTEAQSSGVGINWYLNDNIQLWLDYDYTTFDGGAAAGSDRESEQALFTRFQFRL